MYIYIYIDALATDHQEKQNCRDPDLKNKEAGPCSREHQHLPHSGQSLRIPHEKQTSEEISPHFVFMASIRIMRDVSREIGTN